MSTEKEEKIAEHLFSLIDKKSIWELEIFSSILNIHPEDLAGFIKQFPMAYGLSIQGKRLYITHELVRDVLDEVKLKFIEWYQRVAPREYSQAKRTEEIRKEHFIDDRPERISSKIKISVYGNNYVVEDVLNDFLAREGLSPSFQYTGGYEPFDFQKTIGNDIYNCQFLLIDYNRDFLSLAPLLFEMPEAFLFIFNPLDKLQIDRLVKMIQSLIAKRKKDILVTFLAIVGKDIESTALDEITSTLSYLVEFLEEKPVYKVSFAILSSNDQVERKMNDLIQTAKMLF
ncbi:MAG: hypothetical protein GOP50_10825 [Candidatus Heimdallarchaeota archaeon]|nr:hypothetical protein [Candidatus Heimdallarchaeota archaeon]